MNILIRKIVKVAGERQAHQDHEITTDRLTIGRGTDQDVLLTGERVSYQHADIRFRGQAFELRAHAPTGVTINGQNSQVARLSDGDQIMIGGYRLTVIPPPEPHLDLALTVEEPREAPSEVLDERRFITGPERLGWLRQRPWAWLGFLLILGVGLGLPGLVAWQEDDRGPLRATPLPDDRFWLSGALSRAHEFIGHECEQCHRAPFERVPNRACKSCHEDMGAHATDVRVQRDITGDRCADCHREHNGREGVVMDDQNFCTDCHDDIDAVAPETQLRDVTDFAREHPDFRVRLLRTREAGEETEWYRTRRLKPEGLSERSGLIFDHKVHLADKGVENETGNKEVMECADCHQPDAAGRGMKPIEMEPHCSRCHGLAFEDDEPERTVPHARPEKVVESLREYFSRRFIEDRPGRFEVDLDRPGAPAAVNVLQQEGTDWVARRTRQTAADVFERRVCDTCHEVERNESGDGTRWSIAPVQLNNDYWMHSARFSHAQHDHRECADCHEAATSKRAGDILMPGIKTCRKCHTGAEGKQGLRSSCITCHRFHYREHGKLEMP